MKLMKSPPRSVGASSPLRARTPQLHSSSSASVANDSQLLRAIQTLDKFWKPKGYAHAEHALLDMATLPAPEQPTLSPLSDALRDALCVLLELTARLDNSGPEKKAELETACAARVLTCLKRFVAGWKMSAYTLVGECCEHKCEQHMVQLALLCVLFRMCREPQLARSIVKEELHMFLGDMCAVNGSHTSDPHGKSGLPSTSTVDNSSRKQFDPLDLLIAVDPFDWCYQPLCTRLMNEDSHVFLVPLGTRSLVSVLRGTSLPTDEITEFEQHLRSCQNRAKTTSRCRALPSIFTFPTSPDISHNDAKTTTMTRQTKLGSLCRRSSSARGECCESAALWKVILNDSARTHLGLRSLVVLALNLSHSSSERRRLLHDISYSRRLFKTYCDPHQINSDSSRENTGTSSLRNPRAVPLEHRFLQCMALAGRTLLPESAPTVTSASEEVVQSPFDDRETRNIGLRSALLPAHSRVDNTNASQKTGAPMSWTLKRRLNAAAGDTSVEVEYQYQVMKLRSDGNLERSRRRHAVRAASDSIEGLRKHLVSSLDVLYSGREHPDPQQTFAQWIKSMPTLETREQERQRQQKMREQQALEKQFQRKAIRRRERDEGLQMLSNDCNVPEESELVVQQEKRERFMRMQIEMRELEQIESDKDEPGGTTDTLESGLAKKKKRKELEAEERKRLLLLDAQKHEERERNTMQREDLYYVEQIMLARVRARQKQEREKQIATLRSNAIEEQQQRIARMRFQDQERQLAERESSAMRVEDLFGRQMRFREADQRKTELQNEWRTRKAMQAEEHDSRTRWMLLDQELDRQQQEELKHQRAEARRLRRQEHREEQALHAAWVESWDEQGNRYYYNSLSGLSQWEAPS